MGQYIDYIKDISSALGAVVSIFTVLSLVSKNVREFFVRIFRKYGKADEMTADISELKQLMRQHIEDGDAFRAQVMEMNQINVEFMKNQCRNTVKDIFYRYKEDRVLPLYEKKTLSEIEDLYVRKMDGNTYAKFLLNEMKEWDVDYESTDPVDDNN